MTSRREFTQLSALGAGLLSAPAWAGKTGTAPFKFDYFLIEEGVSVHGGVATEKIRGLSKLAKRFHVVKNNDVSEFWFDLAPRIQRRPHLLAGLTSGYSAFVIAQVLQDYGDRFARANRASATRTDSKLGGNVLSPLDLNTAPTVHWVITKSGKALR